MRIKFVIDNHDLFNIYNTITSFYFKRSGTFIIHWTVNVCIWEGYGGNWRITFGFLLQNIHFQKNVISYGINDKDKMTSKTTVAVLTLMSSCNLSKNIWRTLSCSMREERVWHYFSYPRYYLCIKLGWWGSITAHLTFSKIQSKVPSDNRERREWRVSQTDWDSPDQIDQT